jgi:hypothetical protein
MCVKVGQRLTCLLDGPLLQMQVNIPWTAGEFDWRAVVVLAEVLDDDIVGREVDILLGDSIDVPVAVDKHQHDPVDSRIDTLEGVFGKRSPAASVQNGLYRVRDVGERVVFVRGGDESV